MPHLLPPLPPADPEDEMVTVLERIAVDLERVITGVYACAGLLGFIAFILTVKLTTGR